VLGLDERRIQHPNDRQHRPRGTESPADLEVKSLGVASIRL
jgi:hypothetical protein